MGSLDRLTWTQHCSSGADTGAEALTTEPLPGRRSWASAAGRADDRTRGISGGFCSENLALEPKMLEAVGWACSGRA